MDSLQLSPDQYLEGLNAGMSLLLLAPLKDANNLVIILVSKIRT